MKEINIKILKDELRDLQEALNEQMEAMIGSEDPLPRIEFDIIMENIRKMYDDLNKLYRLYTPYEKERSSPGSLNIPPLKEKKPERRGDSFPGNTNNLSEKKMEPPVSADPSGTASLFSFEDLGFTEKLQEAREKSLGIRSRQNNPGDMKSLININDKFLFINELFDGNLRDYSQAIERLNSMKEKQEAFDYIAELLKQNLWNSQSPAFIKLKGIIEKWFV